MLVKGTAEYSDTVTGAFRKLSVSGHSEEQVSFSYLDVDKHEEFVKMFGKFPSSLRRCDDGSKARPVSCAYRAVFYTLYISLILSRALSLSLALSLALSPSLPSYISLSSPS